MTSHAWVFSGIGRRSKSCSHYSANIVGLNDFDCAPTLALITFAIVIAVTVFRGKFHFAACFT